MGGMPAVTLPHPLQWARRTGATLARPVAFFGALLLAAGAVAGGRQSMSARDLGRVAAEASARALMIVAVVNALVGAILAFVGAVQLVKFGAGIYVADLVGIAVAREMAAVITAVVMAGRTGAAFAAELAAMQTNEEVDALEVLGVDPLPFLVLPRVLSLLLLMPLLYVYACVAGLSGGLLVAAGMLDLAPAAYLDRTLDILNRRRSASASPAGRGRRGARRGRGRPRSRPPGRARPPRAPARGRRAPAPRRGRRPPCRAEPAAWTSAAIRLR